MANQNKRARASPRPARADGACPPLTGEAELLDRFMCDALLALFAGEGSQQDEAFTGQQKVYKLT